MDIKHRGSGRTAETYKGIPIHAAPGVHAAAVDLLKARLPSGARVTDIGAGQGALSARLRDAGYEVVAIDLSNAGWAAPNIPCHVCDLGGNWADVTALGPFDAVLSLEVIEHLENPRDFLRKVIGLAEGRTMHVILSTPNPLDTFSCISLFTRGLFNWFGPQHYAGGGHISILPYWLIDKHLEYLGAPRAEWRFLSPFRHPSAMGQFVYRSLGLMRRLVSKDKVFRHHEGECALMIVTLGPK